MRDPFPIDSPPPTRAGHLHLADSALRRAETLANRAEHTALSDDPRFLQEKTPALVAAAALWADVARTHAAIAAALPERTDQTTED
ncbi:hypothetical protein AB0G81_24950 [Streptomyces asoensis]|uniref:hypothetical protein n=1 Tax=Streptomyces asoensis TaxID=249586 RepID=UPI0033EC5179